MASTSVKLTKRIVDDAIPKAKRYEILGRRDQRNWVSASRPAAQRPTSSATGRGISGQALPSASSPSGATARSRPMKQEPELGPRSERSPQAGTRRSSESMLRPRSPAANWRTGFSKNMSDRRERRTPRKATAPASEATSSRRSGSVKPSWSRLRKSPSYTCLCGIGRIRRTASWRLSAACTPLPRGGAWCPAGRTRRSASSDLQKPSGNGFLEQKSSSVSAKRCGSQRPRGFPGYSSPTRERTSISRKS